MRIVTLCLLLLACARPATMRPRLVVEPLPREDPRQVLVGLWRISFVADSLRGIIRTESGVREQWRSPSVREVHGEVTIHDSLAGWRSSPGRDLRGYLRVNFEPILGRQISCFDPGSGLLGASIQGDSVSIWFTPGAGDCGLVSDGTLHGDSIVGTWAEPSFSGYHAMGSFVMSRQTAH